MADYFLRVFKQTQGVAKAARLIKEVGIRADEDLVAVAFEQGGESPFAEEIGRTTYPASAAYVGEHGGEDGDLERLDLGRRILGQGGPSESGQTTQQKQLRHIPARQHDGSPFQCGRKE